MHEPHRNQKDAITADRRQAMEHQPSQVVVHGRDGKIRMDHTYQDAPTASPADRAQGRSAWCCACRWSRCSPRRAPAFPPRRRGGRTSRRF
ncbi:DUF2188 domain-containing protein [Streptomyces sp. NPDC003943]